MLGFLTGLSTSVQRESANRDRDHVRDMNMKRSFLDDTINQSRWQANYDLQKSDLESILESRQLGRDQTRQSMRHREDRHPRELEGLDWQNRLMGQTYGYNEQANPKRLEAMEWQNKMSGQTYGYNEQANPKRLESMDWANKSAGQGYHQREKTFAAQEPYLGDMARLGRDQAKANVGLTKAQTDYYRRPRAGSSKSVLGKPTRQNVVDMFKEGNIGQTMTDQGNSFWFWGNKVLPYDAPEGQASQKGYLRGGGQQAARRLRSQVPVGDLTYNDVYGYADAAWQAILESDYAEDFMSDLSKGVSAERRLTRVEDARRQFIQSFVNEMMNPAATKTIDSPGMGGDTEIDPGMLDRPIGRPGIDAPALRPDAPRLGRPQAPAGTGEGPPALRPDGGGNALESTPTPGNNLQAPAIRPAPAGRTDIGTTPLGDVGVKWGEEHNRTAVNIAQQVFGMPYTSLTPVQQRAVALAAHDLMLDEMSPERDAFLNSISETDKALMKQVTEHLMMDE